MLILKYTEISVFDHSIDICISVTDICDYKITDICFLFMEISVFEMQISAFNG